MLFVHPTQGIIRDLDAVEHDARVRLYRLEPHVFASLSDWAAAMRDEWSEQLQSFKAHAEGVGRRARHKP